MQLACCTYYHIAYHGSFPMIPCFWGIHEIQNYTLMQNDRLYPIKRIEYKMY